MSLADHLAPPARLQPHALLAASAEASEELARIMRDDEKDSRSKSRKHRNKNKSRSRSGDRTRSTRASSILSPAAAVDVSPSPSPSSRPASDGESDAFLVHTTSSSKSISLKRSLRSPTGRSASVHVRHHSERQRDHDRERQDREAQRERRRIAASSSVHRPRRTRETNSNLPSSPRSGSSSPVNNARPSRSNKHDHHRRTSTSRERHISLTHHRSSSHHPSLPSSHHHRRRSSSHRRTHSRSLSRSRRDELGVRGLSSSPNLLQPAHAVAFFADGDRDRPHRRSRSHSRSRSELNPLSSSPSHHRHRSRSRSHSRSLSRPPPPFQTHDGGVDHEMLNKFGPDRLHHPYGRQSMDEAAAVAAMEQARRNHEERIWMAEQNARESLRSPYETYGSNGMWPDESGMYASYQRRGHPFRARPFGPSSSPDDDDASDYIDEMHRRFRLDEDIREEEDEVKREPALVDGSVSDPAATSSLFCHQCKTRYADASTDGGARVPRYLLCAHTWCTSCLTKMQTEQEELQLANDTTTTTTSAVSASAIGGGFSPVSIRCPISGCAPTPLSTNGVSSLPVNQNALDLAVFMRARRAAGLGLSDSTIGRGIAEQEEKVSELNAELEEDAKHAAGVALSYGLTTALPCQQCQVQLATLFCQACNIRFCSGCSSSVHVGRALSEHVRRGLVITLNVARARGLLFTDSKSGTGAKGVVGAATNCPQHHDQPLSLYCCTCQVPVCRDCITQLFQGRHQPPAHDVDRLSTVLASTTRELKLSVTSIEGVIAKLETENIRAGKAVAYVTQGVNDLRNELHESFATIRSAVLKALAEREKALEADLMAHAKVKEQAVQDHRANLAKLLVQTKVAREEGVRVLATNNDSDTNNSNGYTQDIYSIKALVDVRAAINAGSNPPPPLPMMVPGASAPSDVLLRLKPRELIRCIEGEISQHGGVVATLPSPPSFVSFDSSATSLTIAWAPTHRPAEGELLEWKLEVCELPSRAWHASLRQIKADAFPDKSHEDIEHDDLEEEGRWNGDGMLASTQRAAVNWMAIPPGAIKLGGDELVWHVDGGAPWAGNWVTLYTGDEMSVKHENMSLECAYIYRLTATNDLGSSQPTYTTPLTLPCLHLAHESDMDSNGLVSYLGSGGGLSPWTNPAPSLLDISASSIQLGECNMLTGRAAATFSTLNRHLSWIKIDLGRAQPFRILLTHYTLAVCGRGVGVRRVPRSWALQGSNNGIDWVTLREHVRDETLPAVPLATATWPVNQPTPEAYQYVRILQTDVNHAGDHHLSIGQIELYGWMVRE